MSAPEPGKLGRSSGRLFLDVGVDRKEKYQEICKSRDITVTDDLKAYIDYVIKNDKRKPEEVMERQLTDELEEVEEQIMRLQETKTRGKGKARGLSAELMDLAAKGLETKYPDLKGNWLAIKLRAFDDYRKGRLIGPKSEQEIRVICLRAEDLQRLRARRDTIRAQLKHLDDQHRNAKNAPNALNVSND